MARNVGLKIPYAPIWERIMSVTGWDKDRQLADFLDVQPGTISGARHRDSFPIQWAFKIAQEYGCLTDWIMTGEGRKRHSGPSEPVATTDEIIGKEYVRVPRYEVAASAGGGAFVESEQVVDYLSFRSEWVKNALGVSVKDLALINVIGDSMEPTLSDGDVVLLDMTFRGVQDSSIYVLQLNGTLLVKRIQHRLDGSLEVISDNQRYKPETVIGDDANQLKIIGRVVWAGRKM